LRPEVWSAAPSDRHRWKPTKGNLFLGGEVIYNVYGTCPSVLLPESWSYTLSSCTIFKHNRSWVIFETSSKQVNTQERWCLRQNCHNYNNNIGLFFYFCESFMLNILDLSKQRVNENISSQPDRIFSCSRSPWTLQPSSSASPSVHLDVWLTLPGGTSV
jgi:hypothetical protein